MVLIFTKLQTDKQDVIEVADFKTLSNKKKYQKNFVICHLILQIFFFKLQSHVITFIATSVLLEQ